MIFVYSGKHVKIDPDNEMLGVTFDISASDRRRFTRAAHTSDKFDVLEFFVKHLRVIVRTPQGMIVLHGKGHK